MKQKSSKNKQMLPSSYLDEGYIKYNCDWQIAPPLNINALKALNASRKRMYDLELIGYYAKHGVGYGNISQRWHPQNGHLSLSNTALQFVISGTQTGHLAALSEQHYSLVSSFNIAANTLVCQGPIKASSEALTHAAIYCLDRNYEVVIHVHHRLLWEGLLGKIPTSRADVPYGTPEMAYEIKRLYKEENLAQHRIMAMAGHDEGIISFGATFSKAEAVLLQYLKKGGF